MSRLWALSLVLSLSHAFVHSVVIDHLHCILYAPGAAGFCVISFFEAPNLIPSTCIPDPLEGSESELWAHPEHYLSLETKVDSLK